MAADTNGMVNIRRKNFQEAADSGLLLWRENFVYFLPLYTIPLWICAFASRFFLPEKFQMFSWLIIWYFKPFFDRIIVHIISIRFFERDAGFKRLFKGLWKTLFRGLAGDLLWRRFSPLRSAMMPVRVLEKNLKSGKSTLMRKKHLKNGGMDYGFLLSIWGLCLEFALLLGEFIFFNAINELMLNGNIDTFDFPVIEIYLFAAWCFNLMIIETIYVCMGFSLYINSRIAVEGWDLELIFKDFAEKFRDNIKTAAVIILLAASLFLPSFSYSEELKGDYPYEELQKILEDPDFGGKKDSWGIRLKNELDRDDDSKINYDKLWALLKKLREFFASGLRVILVCIIVVLIIVLIIYTRKIKFRKTEKYDVPSVNTLKTKIMEDPKTLLDKAINYNAQGNIRLAWGYCIAAAIQSWQLYRGIVFPSDATETDCSKIINMKAADASSNMCSPNEACVFDKVIKNWIYFAYAGRLPSDENFTEAVEFCVSIRNKNG